MSSKTIGIIADNNLNIDMLVWSLYYLSGQTHYYYHGFDYWFDVSDEPFDRTSQPDSCVMEIEYDGSGSKEEILEQIESLKKADEHDGLRVIVTRISHESTVDQEVVEVFKEQCDSILLVSSFGVATLYTNKLHKELEFMVDDFMETYFADARSKWEDVDHTPWDRREYIALNFRPFIKLETSTALELDSFKHCDLTYADLYEHLDTKIEDVFKFIDTPIDQSRYENWAAAYEEWRQSVRDIVIWDRDFKQIVRGIVAGVDFDLTRYKLDIMREAALLNELLYKHNLNVKGYGLEELPRNTQGIHELLEPNFHPLSEY